MEAREPMTKPVATVRSEASLAAVARVMPDRRIGCAPVVDERSRPCGIVTESRFATEELLFSPALVPRASSEAMPREVSDRIRVSDGSKPSPIPPNSHLVKL